ncbi:MAG: PQQ-binding-like beta-propeller repeat protein [Betaproteobacteria bacterium]
MRTCTAMLMSCLAGAAMALDGGAQFRGDAAHTGVYAAPAKAPVGQLKWRFHTGGPVVSSAAVVGDTVYVGSGDHQVHAIDARTGLQRWKFATRGRVSSSPAVVDGVVYVGSYDGKVFAIDAASGRQKWVFATEGERRFAAPHLHGAEPRDEVMPDVFDFFLSSPTVVDGRLFVGSGDRHVYALDATDGHLLWKVATTQVVHASPAVADGLVVVGDWSSALLALDARTGVERWRFEGGRDDAIHNQEGFQSSPAIADGVVFVGCRDAHLYAVDLHSGALRWSFSTGKSWVISSPAVRDGQVFFATSDTGRLTVVDARTGREIGAVDNQRWPMFSSPALAGRRAYIGTHRGQLLAIDVDTRALAWTFSTPASHDALKRLTKADGTPDYEAAFTDFFYDDMVAGTYTMLSGGALLASPVVADGVVIVGSMDGDVYAVE